VKRRVGRPRATGTAPKGEPREVILREAAMLFAEKGYTATSTREIALAAGLRQSAIFHWFASKEIIFETLFGQGWDRSLEYFERIDKTDLPGAVKLCLCLTFDARLVVEADPHIKLVMIPPELRQPRFKKLLRKRLTLIRFLEKFIKRGIKDGDFREVNPGPTARTLLAIDEIVLDAAREDLPLTPEDHAKMVVDFSLHALAKSPEQIAPLLNQVEEFRAKDKGE